MPNYRGVTIELHSQFDVDTLPEYFPYPGTYYTHRDITAPVPSAVSDLTSTCSVYVPVFPGSQFWLSYHVSPPVPEDQMYFFKLFINGNHIVSWSCGKQEGWKGKTMFGLFEREREDGRKIIEKRVLRFGPLDENGEWTDVDNAFDESAYLEIKVYRAHGRRRIARSVGAPEYVTTAHAQSEKGIELVNAGRAGGEHPKRFYEFALIDPLDQPFASFRYYYRTWDQLEYLGLLDEDNEFIEEAIPEPVKRRPISVDIEDAFVDASPSNGDQASTPPHVFTRINSYQSDTDQHAADSDLEQGKRQSRARTPSQFYRLSVPQSLKLDPPNPSIRNLPPIPQKKDSFSSTGYRPHPAYPAEDWIERTPSPVKSIRDGISTPPLFRRRGFTAMSLINVVASAWKRRVSNSEHSSDTESRAASRGRDVS